MQHQMYAVKDKAAAAFLQPFFTPTEGTAIRAIQSSVSDANHMFHRHAKDYSLYYLGFFDDNTGVLVPLQEPVFVCSMETLIIADGRFEKDVNHG